MGVATALEFAREGAAVLFLHYNRSAEKARELAEEVRALGSEAVPVQGNLSDPVQTKILAGEVLQKAGTLDVLVCFSGLTFDRDLWFRPFEEVSREDFEAIQEADLFTAIHLTQAFIPAFKAQKQGRIILFGSTPAITGHDAGIPYFLAKAGVLALTRGLAHYLGPYNIHVNAIAPGSFDTGPMGALTKEERRELEEETALGRWGRPEEIARKVVYLASEDSEFQTGTTMIVDGGFAIR